VRSLSATARRAQAGLALLAVGLSVAACSRAHPAATVVIGAHLPLTGPDAEAGVAMARGYRRAVEVVNAAGGLRIGRPARAVRVRLDLRDDGGDPAMVDALVEALAGAGCHALLGTASDVRTAMEAAVADRLGVPLVVNGTDAPGLPGSRQEWVFSVEVTGDLEARAYATARALLDGIETARTIDPVALRNALVNR
jgi:branched-chain amino acid transport system substrate-binding protein